MKSKFYFLAVAVIMATVFSGCEKPEKTWLKEGSVTTGVACDVTEHSAKLEGTIYPLEAEVTEMGFYYDTTPEMVSLQKIVATDGFSTVLTGLNANTTYYYYAYAKAYGRTKDGDTKMFKTKEPDPEINGHAYVDLGLPSGTLWATCNVGASTPEGYGTAFPYGTSVTWGDNWRTPTKADLEELIGTCSFQWTTKNDINGVLFTGPNGKSIFMPASGYSGNSQGKLGHYWSSTPISSNSNYYYFLVIQSSNVEIRESYYSSNTSDYYRNNRSIRPCCPR